MALLAAPLPAAAQESPPDGAAPAGPQFQMRTEAEIIEISRRVYGTGCYAMTEEAAQSGAYVEPPQRFEVTLPGFDGSADPVFIVWQVFCDAGAYNMMHVYWLEGEYIGLKPLAFPMPVFEVILEDPENPDSAVREVRQTGWTARERLVNSGFDPATLTFGHYAKYRGLGDAFETGEWVLSYEEVVTTRFEVDATYDEEINPVQMFPAP
jgi:hypothetical protein